MNIQRKENGFTIIEVVLVLAIAGLIFLMVFIALPALQRSQRDGQRRDDAGRFMSQVNSFQTNNNGKVPAETKITGTDGFANRYLKMNEGEFKDPQTGEDYKFTSTIGGSKTDTFVYVVGAECEGEDIKTNSKNRSVALQIELEGSGLYCQDNQ